MSVLTVYAGTENDSVYSGDSGTYSTMRNGVGLAVESSNLLPFQSDIGGPTYRGFQGFLRFDTSSLTSAATISSSVLNMVCAYGGDASSDHQARIHDFGATVTSGDWVAGGTVAGKTLVAHKAVGSLSSSTRYDWTDDALAANTSKTGYTSLILSEADFAADVAPTTNHSGSWVKASGGANDPRLTVTYTMPATGPANLESLNTNLAANIKSINTNLIANVKSVNTVV